MSSNTPMQPPRAPHHPTEWPPLIGAANAPGWVFWRDVALTLLAWCALGLLLLESLTLAVDYFLLVPRFEFTHHEPVDWLVKWALLRPFTTASALLVLWMLVWALLRARPLAARSAQPAPAPLALAEHAARWGLDAPTVATWRKPSVALARFDDAQQLRAVQAMVLPLPSEASEQRE